MFPYFCIETFVSKLIEKQKFNFPGFIFMNERTGCLICIGYMTTNCHLFLGEKGL